jgi:hypothetical protein
MPGLVPGIHVLRAVHQRVDGRDKPGHDAVEASCHTNPTIGIVSFCHCFARRRKRKLRFYRIFKKANDFRPIPTVHGVVFAFFVLTDVPDPDCNCPACRYARASNTR